MKKLTRYCGPCDALVSSNPCRWCGADTDRWPADDSETDREYQERAKNDDDGREYGHPADRLAGRQ